VRVMVTGSRRWTDEDAIRRALHFAAGGMGMETAPGVTLIHGAARGADTIAAHLAVVLGWSVVPYPADWSRHGKAAGPIRNREMLDSKPDVVLAFPLPMSRGTRDVIREAVLRCIPCYVHGEGWVR
jgi:hypothetical protein